MNAQKPIAMISTCNDIIQCSFGLSDFDLDVFRAMIKFGPIRADDLANKMKKERSPVYRALQRLTTCNMCYRETKYLQKGGYYHLYSAISKKILKHKLEQCVNEWNNRIQDALTHFDEKYDF